MEKEKHPFISVLLAVRNEEAVIERCLDSLVKQDYPADNFEILIGNDQSWDGTGEIISKYEKKHENIKQYFIEKKLNDLDGKANVLAVLAQQAKGDFFLFTDADMLMPQSWITSMLVYCDINTGIVNGYTIPKVTGVFSGLQATDWLLAQKQIQLLKKWEVPVTAMGNNMFLKKEAYLSTGGYENMGYSITEDFQLFKEIITQGWNFETVFNRTDAAITLPEKKLSGLLSQRLRWMTGAFNLPLKLLLPLLLQAIALPIIIVLFLFSPVLGVLIFLSHWLILTAFLFLTILETKQYLLLRYFLFYDLYNLILSSMLLVMYILKVKIIWKDRNYHI